MFNPIWSKYLGSKLKIDLLAQIRINMFSKYCHELLLFLLMCIILMYYNFKKIYKPFETFLLYSKMVTKS